MDHGVRKGRVGACGRKSPSGRKLGNIKGRSGEFFSFLVACSDMIR